MCLNSRGGDVVLQFAPATLAKLTLWPFYEERENFQSEYTHGRDANHI